jgi:hypothetical protein
LLGSPSLQGQTMLMDSRRLLAARVPDRVWESHYNSQAALSSPETQQSNPVGSNEERESSDGTSSPEHRHPSRVFKPPSLEHITSYTQQQELTPSIGGLHMLSQLPEKPPSMDLSGNPIWAPPISRDDRVMPDPPVSLESPDTTAEPQILKVVNKPRGVELLAMQVAKMAKRREKVMNLRIRGRELRKLLGIYRGEADTISVKLQELLADSGTTPQRLQQLMGQLRSAQADAVELNLTYNEHEALLDEKDYKLTEMETRFNERYGEVTFAEDLALDESASSSDDDDESYFSDETRSSPIIPTSLGVRDKYVDTVEKAQNLRAELEEIHHERSYLEIEVAREHVHHQVGSELSSDTSRALEEKREQERALVKRIKEVEDRSKQLEQAAIAAGEMPASRASPIAEEDNIRLELAQPDRHPLLFPFPDIDQARLHFNEASDENDLPVGVTDWSLYRLRSTALDVDLYKANSEPNMWSKASSPKSQSALDQQLSDRILNSWHRDAVQNRAPMLGPLTSEVSEDVIPAAAASEVESRDGRDFPKVSELLRPRWLPFPTEPGLEDQALPWTRTRSAPDLDGSSRRDLLFRSKH